MKVAAIIVTRGDHDLTPVLASLPEEWEVLVWDNGKGTHFRRHPGGQVIEGLCEIPDLSVYGRYAAIAHTDAELIYVQDDDCVVSDPGAVVRSWNDVALELGEIDRVNTRDHVVCNMPPEFRHRFYQDHALVGFGAAFHRDAPERAFQRWDQVPIGRDGLEPEMEIFRRTCDIVFTGLTPLVLVDVPVRNLPWAYDADRMYHQRGHLSERSAMLDLVRKVRTTQ